MHSLQFSREMLRRNPSEGSGHAECEATVRSGCPVCQGPLLLAACLGLNPAGPAQHIYRCEACDHLEWFEQPAPANVVH